MRDEHCGRALDPCGVFQHDAQRVRFVPDLPVALHRPGQRQPVGDQLVDAQGSALERAEHGLEVALLGPAHEAEGVVLPAPLVILVVATGSVGARHLERQLLLVEVGASQVQPHHADQHDPPPLATALRGLMHDLVALGRRRDQHTVGTALGGPGPNGGEWIAARGEIDRSRAEPLGQPQPSRVGIDRQHLATVRAQQLDRQQAE